MTGLMNYHKSIGDEISSAKNRVRSLLAPTVHWGEDGRSKEDILKFVLARHIPQTVGIYSGFVRLRERSSTQIDVLLVDKTKPMLFSTNDFCITTPSNAYAIIEVKTKINRIQEFKTIIEKQVEDVSEIRRLRNEQSLTYSPISLWCGIFVYDSSSLNTEEILKVLDDVANKDFHRIVNMICLGPNIFIRYWPVECKWIAYRLESLAYSYFISNLIWQDEPSSLDQESWFALQEGKDRRETCQQMFTTN